MVTMTTASGFSCGSPTGRIDDPLQRAHRSGSRPRCRRSIASHSGMPASQMVHTMKVVNIAISPCGEVEQAGGAVDHDQAEAQHGVDRPVAEADHEVPEGSRSFRQLPGTPSGWSRRAAARRRCPTAHDRAGLEHVGARRRTRGRGWRSARRAAPRRRCSLTMSPRRSNTSLVTSGARPSDGSSSRISRGRRHQRPGDGEHLLLAAATSIRRPGCDARRAAGTSSNQRVDVGVDLGVLAGVGTDAQVLLDREVDDRAPALGHVGDARCARSGRAACRAIDLPVEAAPRPRPGSSR